MVIVVPYEAVHTEVFVAALNEAIGATADCYPVSNPSDQALLSVKETPMALHAAIMLKRTVMLWPHCIERNLHIHAI